MSQPIEQKLSDWAGPPGDTEKAKCEHAVAAIRAAIDKHSSLSQFQLGVFAQGSYRNRTNVRADSDVDVCVVNGGTYFYDLPPGSSPQHFSIIQSSYPYESFKNEIELALRNHFGKQSVFRGNKAFDIHENTYRVNADVVACFEYRKYGLDGTYLKGTGFLTDNNKSIINWPDHNYENGVEKNQLTARRFKALVRIFKNLRNEMADQGIISAKAVHSYLLESLLWNIPNMEFCRNDYYEATQSIIGYLLKNTYKYADYLEINGIKALFAPSQSWNAEITREFLISAGISLALQEQKESRRNL